MPRPERTAAILVAAGRGLRAGAGGPKQYRTVGGKTVILRAMEAFCTHPDIATVQPVVNPDDIAIFNDAVCSVRHAAPVNGGATRQASVHAGLEALASSKPDIVLIHDAARPFVTEAVISRAIDAAGRTGAAIPAVAVTDTIKLIGASGDVEATPERARLRIAQTPQAFRYEVILEAHRRAVREARHDFTDDAALAEWAGLTVATFEGDPANMKLTTPEDFVREEARLAASLGDIRTGTGYDVHAFGEGDHVMICGVRVPHNKGFLAHSDGDVGLHALVDAILGRAGRRRHRLALSAQRSQMERRLLRPLSQICGRSRHRARRTRCQFRSDHDLRAAEDRPAARHHAGEDCGDFRRRHFAHRGESDDQRAARLYRPRGRHRGHRERHHTSPLERMTMSGSDARALSRSLLDLCRMRKLTIATAESCTGGLVAGALTDIPGSSDVIDRGFVTYSNDAKRAMLGVKASTLATFGAVSKETATQMAVGALERAGVDLAVAITGIAGPGGATPGKPVGLVHFAVASRDGRILHREQRFGAIGRIVVRERSVVEALRMLMELARGPQAAKKPQREAASRLRVRVARSPRRATAKRRRPPRG